MRDPEYGEAPERTEALVLDVMARCIVEILTNQEGQQRVTVDVTNQEFGLVVMRKMDKSITAKNLTSRKFDIHMIGSLH